MSITTFRSGADPQIQSPLFQLEDDLVRIVIKYLITDQNQAALDVMNLMSTCQKAHRLTVEVGSALTPQQKRFAFASPERLITDSLEGALSDYAKTVTAIPEEFVGMVNYPNFLNPTPCVFPKDMSAGLAARIFWQTNDQNGSSSRLFWQINGQNRLSGWQRTEDDCQIDGNNSDASENRFNIPFDLKISLREYEEDRKLPNQMKIYCVEDPSYSKC